MAKEATKDATENTTEANQAPKDDVSFIEKVGDFFNGLTEGVSRLLLSMFGSSNERYVRKLGYLEPKSTSDTAQVVPGSLLAQVNSFEETMKAKSDEELMALTPHFRERLAKGEKLDDILPEAFAAVREAGWRTKKMRHYDVQILGGIVLHRGNIAEMVTGEGKTLVATLPAYLNALTEKGVHVVTVNDYLARRDCEWMLPIFRALGMEAGYIQSDMDPVARRNAYDCDITYGTNSEFGFDYLRDNMKSARWADENYPSWQHQCQRALHYAIIDEVDNILIDEARTPLIISGAAHTDLKRYGQANDISVQLTSLQAKGEGPYYEVKEKEHTCHLTDAGVRKAEELAKVESFYTAGNMDWPHLIDNSLKAHHLYRRGKQYEILPDPDSGEKAIIIIDEHTGRLMHGRQWSDGLHQAVEAKHAKDGVRIKEETQTLATVTLQNFFRLYDKLSGMTGTAMTEANEFWKIYKLDVIAIPTNKPLIRIEHPDLVYRSEDSKWNAVLEEVIEVHKTGRPMLIGTTDVEKSLKLSALLKRRGIKHELLNALPEHAAREAEIVAQAGRIGSVTIATNMAGRGTDIILGGNPETLAWAKLKDKYETRLDVPEAEWKALVEEIQTKEKMKEQGREIADMGGLHIIGTERHDARRIDNQLRGRAGRQGDPGSSRFYVSLSDDLMRLFGGEWVANWLGRLGMAEDQAIESRMVSKKIKNAQKKIEERHFDSRKSLLEYDEVMDTQRKQVYGYRQEILEGANCKLRILEMIDKQIDDACERFLDENYGPATFAEFAAKRLNVTFETADFNRTGFEEAKAFSLSKAHSLVETYVRDIIEEHLSDENEKAWNWQALATKANLNWGMSTNERELKKIGKDGLYDFLTEKANESIERADLDDGKDYLETNWGLRSLCEWCARKFLLALEPEDIEKVIQEGEVDLATWLKQKVREQYTEKEINFPVQVAMATFMAERSRAPGQSRYDRDGLHAWALSRFPSKKDELKEDDFHTQSRAKLFEKMLDISRKCYPEIREDQLDEKLEEVLGSDSRLTEEKASELVGWVSDNLGLDLDKEQFYSADYDKAREMLWDGFELKYRPEMRKMERSLLLNQLDSAWKNHLHTMDHLMSSVRLRWVGQMDPKIEYKREGMKEHAAMWESVEDKVTDTVFRMEEADDAQETLWQITDTIHEEAARLTPQDAPQEHYVTNSSSDGKKAEPIRRRDQRVGRNDPCTCGSGKKYKNCCLKVKG